MGGSSRRRSRSLHWTLTLCLSVAACGGTVEDARHGFDAPNDDAMSVAGDATPAGSKPMTQSPAGTTTNPGSTTGTTGNTGPSATPSADGWPTFGTSKAWQLRRLTTEQYVASAQALLGVSTDGMPPIEHVSAVGGFSAIGASSVSVSAVGVGQFEAAARFLAQAAFAATGPRQKLVPCTPSGVADMACFESFATTFGKKVFRRPLSAEEVSRYAALTAAVASSTSDVWQGLEATVSAFLQSPNFLYLTEVGAPDPANAKRYRFASYEMASRLAYFLTNDMPDDALLMAAESGELLTNDGIASQVTRLLEQPAAHDSIRAFFTSLLALDSLDTLTRPIEVFPKFSASLGPAMREETSRVLDDLVFDRDGDYRHLFDQPETFVNTELAALYGVSAPSGSGFARVTLPASSGRAGLLGQAGVLAARDHSDGTSPTKRGLFVLTRLLCQDLPLMPPANLDIPPPPTGLLTARERLAEHAANSVCAGCHRVTDPVGLSLEHFDAMGVYRDNDHGLSIDDTGVLDGKTYRGAAELGAVLRDHPALSPCLIQQLYGVAVGHLSTEFDRDTFASLVRDFDAHGARIKPLLAAIASSDGFRYLPVPERN